LKEVFNPAEEKKAQKGFAKEAPVTAKEEGKAHLAEEKKAEKKGRKPKVGSSEPFINKYGFLHVNGKLAEHLGIKLGKEEANVPVTIELIEGGFIVRVKA